MILFSRLSKENSIVPLINYPLFSISYIIIALEPNFNSSLLKAISKSTSI
jgi:type IV secretory pathway VirB3-like protein